MTEKFVPLKDFMLLRPIASADKSEGGIIIPDQARKTSNEGVILALGPLCSAEFRVGQHVVFHTHSEFQVKIDEQKVYVVQEVNVILCKAASDIVEKVFDHAFKKIADRKVPPSSAFPAKARS